jgi:hypothetical protein
MLRGCGDSRLSFHVGSDGIGYCTLMPKSGKELGPPRVHSAPHRKSMQRDENWTFDG